jgi:hypothetical protein
MFCLAARPRYPTDCQSLWQTRHDNRSDFKALAQLRGGTFAQFIGRTLLRTTTKAIAVEHSISTLMSPPREGRPSRTLICSHGLRKTKAKSPWKDALKKSHWHCPGDDLRNHSQSFPVKSVMKSRIFPVPKKECF